MKGDIKNLRTVFVLVQACVRLSGCEHVNQHVGSHARDQLTFAPTVSACDQCRAKAAVCVLAQTLAHAQRQIKLFPGLQKRDRFKP